MKDAQERLTHYFGTRVRILPGKKKNRIEIDCGGVDDLTRILDLLVQQAATAEEKQRKIEALRRVSTQGNFTV